jgi:tetratricopeptide (TPR) repeat protein
VLLASILGGGVFRPALADYWYEHYDRAQQALAKQDWSGAIRQLNLAIEKRSDPGTRVKTYGLNFVDYHPYLDLAIAYGKLGQFDAALQALDVEERAGAIAQSKTGTDKLRETRTAVNDAKTQASQTSEQQRRVSAIARSLDEVKSMEAAGDVDGAIAAAGRGLAVDQNNAELRAALTRLQGRAAEAARKRDVEAQYAQWVSGGKTALENGKYEEASALFQQALAAKRTPDLESLLEESQKKLAERIRGTQDASARDATVREALDAAEELGKGARFPEAVAKLQTVLALDPKNERALALQAQLITRQAESDATKLRFEEVTKLLADGEAFLRDGRGDDAATMFNRVLALDPTNAAALASVGRAFALINKAILSGSGGMAVKTPPMILLSNTALLQDANKPANPGGVAEDLREQTVGAPEVALNGMIYDDLPDLQLSLRASSGGAPSEDLPFSPVPTRAEKQGDYFLYAFMQSVPLRPGVSTIQIAATGKDGARRVQLHRVRYIRPWFRSPWTFLIAGIAIAAGVGAIRYRTMRLRNERVRRRFNPYIAGAPIREDDMFLGREALLSKVLQTVHNNSILLYGERRIGKTSLQHHLKKRLQHMQDPKYAFFPVYIDLQGTPQERFFWTLGHEIFHEIGPLLDGKLEGRGPKDGEEYAYETFVRDVRDMLKVLRERTDKTVKVVLLIDEVDELNDYDPRINQKLRSLFMKNFAENLAAVVSGVGIKKKWESEGSPWYNFFEEIEVRAFSAKDAAELIEKPIRGTFTLSQGVIDRIVAKTDCKPYRIQKICIALVNRLHEEGRRRITVADVDAVGRVAEE